ncbi:50S ribosomal protein L13 [candidate division WWE3 bacterium]|nr:50S ribosomal protein L13 [candidate division WWE3 bacterium]
MKITNKTYMEKKNNVRRDWHLFDAEGKVLGDFAAEVAKKLIGKGKPTFTPHINVGDKVVVINAKRIEVSGTKEKNKKYFWHTGYPGGIKFLTFEQLMAKNPARVIEKAVKGMLPRNKLLKERMKNLYVYAEGDHPHAGQLTDNKGNSDVNLENNKGTAKKEEK